MTDRNREPAAPEGEERQQNREGQNQSTRNDNEGGRPGQDNDLAAMEGQETDPRGQQGQPAERGQSDGERGGNR